MTTEKHELSITRLIDAPRKNVWRCWTEAELLKQWFAPKPFTTPVVEFDLRPGGSSNFVMRSPEGQDMPNPGQFLEIVPNEKLVFTDAFMGDWKVSGNAPFMVVTITLADEGGKTRYTARVQHWTAEAKAQHEQMGFETGWGICADQLADVARAL